MTAERDSMTLNEVSVPALGVIPRAGRARTPDGGCRTVHRVSCGFWRRRMHTARRPSPRQLASDGLAQGAAQGWPRRSAARNRLDAKVRALEAQVARLSCTPRTRSWTAGKSCRAAGIEPTERALDRGPTACGAGRRGAGLPSTGLIRASSRSTPGHRQAVQRPPGRCEAEREHIPMCSPARACRPCAGGGRGDAAGTITGSERTDVSDPGRRSAGPRAAQSARGTPSPMATAPNQTWSWDHQAVQVDDL